MTVVCRGAAVYASTLERSTRTAQRGASTTPSMPAETDVQVKLAFDPVSADLEAAVSGRVVKGPADVEIKIEAADGSWTSAWMLPNGGLFETSALLSKGGVTTFWLYARDSQGRALETDAREFKIRHGLIPASPPLPHTLWVEVIGADGKPALEEIFAKNTPLPADRTKMFRAAHAVSRSDSAPGLRVKLWEGEFRDVPEANEWVGQVVIGQVGSGRILPAGAEIELTFRIDASRLILVEGRAPKLNMQFHSEQLYLAQQQEEDFAVLASAAGREADDYRRRVEQIEDATAASGDEATVNELEALRRDLADLSASVPDDARGVSDPDDARRVVTKAKSVRGRVDRLERRLSPAQTPPQVFCSLRT